MQRIIWLGTLLLIVATTCALADIVYVTDGRKLEGTVTQTADTVTIVTEDGTVELSRDQVIHVLMGERSEDPAPEQDPQGPGDPIDEHPIDTPTEEKTDDVEDSRQGITPPDETFSMGEAAMPESIAFTLSRRAVEENDAALAYKLNQQAKEFQDAAHDRRRRVDGDWMTPGDYGTARLNYTRLINDTDGTSNKLRRSRELLLRTTDEDQRAELKAEIAQFEEDLETRLSTAAEAWLDPTIATFLEGVAYYKSGYYSKALSRFQSCRERYPLVIAYHQAYGLAGMHVDGFELDAVDAILDQISLDPDSAQARIALQEAMKNVPSEDIRTDIYERAQNVIDNTDPSVFKSPQQSVWKMPGEGRNPGWLDKEATLPIPPYDRLVFRQSVGVAVSAGVVMVDADTVQNADSVFLRVGNTVVPASVKRTTSAYREIAPQLAWVETTEFQFNTPIVVSDKMVFHLDDHVKFKTLPVFTEMGTTPESASTRITTMTENGDPATLDIMLAPGQGATPVLTEDNRLAGVLLGKTQYLKENGGPDEILPARTLLPIIQKIQKENPPQANANVRMIVDPMEVDTPFVIVYGVEGENVE